MNKFFRGYLLPGAVAVLFSILSPSLQAQTNASSASSVTNRPASPRRPNIVLIFADNVGYGDLGCYGQKQIKTPNLDKLAADGIRFTSFYAGSPSDEPSRASMLTGLEPRHVGASFSHPLPMDAFTVATFLKELGYHTGYIGEWNLGDTAPVMPMAKGFDEFAGFLNQNHARDYFTDAIYRQDTTTKSNSLEEIAPEADGKTSKYVPSLLGKAAGNFIRINKPDKLNRYRPFFLCLAYPIPHFGSIVTNSSYANETWPVAEKVRATLITRMDENIGELLQQLAKYKVETNTVVLFTSIGGPKTEGTMGAKFFDSAGPLRGTAGTVYEGGIRVPMIARWPAAIKAGQTNDFAWAAWDLFPTFAEIALAKPPEKLDGLSALAALGGEKPKKQHDSFYWESRENEPQQAVRAGDWKLIRGGTNSVELYNLKMDIGETNNVAGKNATVVQRLQKLIEGK